jgi:hypothetical protein
MRRFRSAMRSSSFITWHTTDDLPPTWKQAAQRIMTDDRPSPGESLTLVRRLMARSNPLNDAERGAPTGKVTVVRHARELRCAPGS